MPFDAGLNDEGTISQVLFQGLSFICFASSVPKTGICNALPDLICLLSHVILLTRHNSNQRVGALTYSKLC